MQAVILLCPRGRRPAVPAVPPPAAQARCEQCEFIALPKPAGVQRGKTSVTELLDVAMQDVVGRHFLLLVSTNAPCLCCAQEPAHASSTLPQSHPRPDDPSAPAAPSGADAALVNPSSGDDMASRGG